MTDQPDQPEPDQGPAPMPAVVPLALDARQVLDVVPAGAEPLHEVTPNPLVTLDRYDRREGWEVLGDVLNAVDDREEFGTGTAYACTTALDALTVQAAAAHALGHVAVVLRDTEDPVEPFVVLTTVPWTGDR